MYRNLYVSVVLAALVATSTVACGDKGNPFTPSVAAPSAPPPPPQSNPGGGSQATPLSVDPTRSEISEGTSKMLRVTGGNPSTEPVFRVGVYARVAGTTARPVPVANALAARAGTVAPIDGQHRFVSASGYTAMLKQEGWDFDYVELEVTSPGVSPAYTRICYKGHTCNAPTN